MAVGNKPMVGNGMRTINPPLRPSPPKTAFAIPSQPNHLQRRPAAMTGAPPVYRPEPPVLRPLAPAFAPPQDQLQRHTAGVAGAPPVYRPAAPGVRPPAPAFAQQNQLQRHAAGTGGAPPVYRPKPPNLRLPAPALTSQQKQVQRRSAVGAPLVYRPDPSQKPLPPAGITHAAVQARSASPQRVKSTIQRYETLAAGRIFPSEDAIDIPRRKVAVIADSEDNFIWQQKQHGTFLESEEEGAGANLARASRLRLRVSDDWQMAIQDTDLSNTQPKAFYATETVFQDSRTKLREVNSKFALVKTARVLTLWDGSSTRRQLTQLLPQSVETPVENPLSLRVRQDCNSLSERVTGSDNLEMYPTSSHRLSVHKDMSRVEMGGLSQIAALVAELMGHSRGGRGAGVVDAASQEELNQVNQAIATEYNQALTDPDGGKLDGILRELFVIGSVGAPDESGRLTDLQTGNSFVPKWPYHFGGVVAKSGSDTVTLENYARGGEVVGNRAQDPRWYFQMYGTNLGQSFHEANVALGGYANAVTTAQHNETRTAQAARAREALTTTMKVGTLVVVVALLGIALGVLRRYNYI